MLQVEKQRTKVADTKPLDYIFTNAGRNISDEEISSGAYRFDYPIRWLQSPSDAKAIGFRRVLFSNRTNAFMFAVYFHGQYKGSDGLIEKFDEMKIFTIRSDESLEKTLNDFQTQMNKYYWEFQEKYDSLLNGTYYLKLEYDKMNSTVSFQKIEINPPRDTEFLYWGVDKRSWAQFLRLLNQNEPLPPDGPFKFILPPADLTVYRNVFDPQNVMCHASFSSSNNSFLCIGKDFYDFASKFYEPPSNSFSDFQVWFTTNGVQHIIPLYYDFYLELSFIYNYGKVLKKY
ncbi:hypothetical protein TVAGG3_0655800 [Trichomonas vaginalis G3]|uniref:hypothetical protein n=1 Tax=Trichomonas vaginalis (strain ATCC PRA-98 / G3) TaxID=412133 RepID=UPI0021E54000|nr:hypothetical protein TVAGG3_0655800 [Trichomonas vaginalis G3]KAI5506171.1 hypothetical protein TVAGG3_0655800 [Trichomonas vaginalis G3]